MLVLELLVQGDILEAKLNLMLKIRKEMIQMPTEVEMLVAVGVEVVGVMAAVVEVVGVMAVVEDAVDAVDVVGVVVVDND